MNQRNAQLEETRQASLRTTFASIASFSGNLNDDLRAQIVAVPSIEASLRGKYPAAPKAPVDGSFLDGGSGGTSMTGEIIESPEFSYNYFYNWGPNTRVAHDDEKFYLRIESKLDPKNEEKPTVRIATRNSELEQQIAKWLTEQFDLDEVIFETEVVRDEAAYR
ncbi:MAG: hypothetical protein AAF483_20105 [Planctomycetota bacterium]